MLVGAKRGCCEGASLLALATVGFAFAASFDVCLNFRRTTISHAEARARRSRVPTAAVHLSPENLALPLRRRTCPQQERIEANRRHSGMRLAP